MHFDIPYLTEILLYLAVAGVLVPVAKRLSISQLLAFLIAGAVFGPHAMGRLIPVGPLSSAIVPDQQAVDAVAEWGVIFLLFTIGLEISLERLWGMRRQVFGLGLAQVAVTATTIALLTRWLGQPIGVAVIVGLALSLSSTAVVMHLLKEQGRVASTAGRTSFSVLLFQDLAVVPILFAVGVLANGGEAPVLPAFFKALAIAVVAVAGIMGLGRLLVRPIFRFVGNARSRELFMAAALLLIVGTTAGTAAAGLSPALGAFLAGLLFSDTEYRHQLGSDIEPFKGLLLGLFFFSVGMSLDIGAVWQSIWLLGFAVVGLYLLKSIIDFIVMRAFSIDRRSAIESALLLGQGGEFAFVICAAAQANGAMPSSIAQFILLTVTLTMFATPAAAALGVRLARSVDIRERAAPSLPALDQSEPRIIIGGFGRVGKLLANVLDEVNIPYLALDTDAERVARMRDLGIPIHFGNASDPEMLKHVGIARSLAFLVTMDNFVAAELMVCTVRRRWPHVPILARARDEQHAALLFVAGASRVVPETFEASLQLSEEMLSSLDFPQDVARSLIDAHRKGFGALLAETKRRAES